MPHSLLRQCLNINESLKSEHKTRNFFLNSILVRENYSWKKSFTNQATVKLSQRETEKSLKQQQDRATATSSKSNFNQSLTTSSSGRKLTKKQQQQIMKDQQHLNLNASLNSNSIANDMALDVEVTIDQSGYEVVPNALLDLFDVKFSCSFLGMHEQHELFYSSGGGGGSETSYKQSTGRKSLGGVKSFSLNTFDENKSGLNVLKRLISKTKMNKSKMRLTEQVESGVLEQRSVIKIRRF